MSQQEHLIRRNQKRAQLAHDLRTLLSAVLRRRLPERVHNALVLAPPAPGLACLREFQVSCCVPDFSPIGYAIIKLYVRYGDFPGKTDVRRAYMYKSDPYVPPARTADELWEGAMLVAQGDPTSALFTLVLRAVRDLGLAPAQVDSSVLATYFRARKLD